MPKCIILRGAPLSGKSTWAKDIKKLSDKYCGNYVIVSADEVRLSFTNGKYKFNSKTEDKVWAIFYERLRMFSRQGFNIIVDNTNLKQGYIDKIWENLVENDYQIEYRYFDVPLWKLILRNYLRYFKTGKWIPIKVIKTMYKNFKKLKQ